MKQLETIIDSKKTHKAIMWLSLLYGGFAIIFFLMDFYSAVWIGGSFFINPDQNNLHDQNDFVNTPDNLRDTNFLAPNHRPQMTPLRIISSPASILLLLSGLISILSGITIMRITKKHEIKAVKQEATEYLLLPEEKKVIEVLKKNDYSLPQNKITKESGLTKVQVHRVLKRLETKGLIEKHEYGLTNKIVLKKEFFE
jgi:uncharacterized membrane protein